MASYSVRLDQALTLVAQAFRGKTRKGGGVPYLSHLLAVCALVQEHGGDEELAAAALLHDYLEDIPGASVQELERRFGSRVARVVLTLSDTMEHPKPPWAPRKQAYVARLARADADVRLVASADKLHNARCTRRDLEAAGLVAWERFSASPGQSLWYYAACHEALASGGWHSGLLDLLGEEVGRMHALSGRTWTPGALAAGPPER